MSGFTYSDWSKGATPPPGFTVYGSDLPEPAPPSYDPPPRRRSGGGGLRRFLGFAAIALVLGGVRYGVAEGIDRARGVRRFPYGTTLHSPDTIGTMPRLHTRKARQIEVAVEADAPADSSPQVAIYGRGGTATYFLVALLSGERTGSEVYHAITSGAPSGDLGEFGPGRAVAGVHCGKVRAGTRHGAACAWSSRLSNGMLVDYGHPDLAVLAARTEAIIGQVNGS